jgi:hypothetical protein
MGLKIGQLILVVRHFEWLARKDTFGELPGSGELIFIQNQENNLCNRLKLGRIG